MGNQLTFTGSGEKDNGMNVALNFILDQGDNATGVATTAEVYIGHDTLTYSSDHGEAHG